MILYTHPQSSLYRPLGQATFSMPRSILSTGSTIAAFGRNDKTFLRLLQPRYSSASRFPSPDFLSKPWITTLAQKNVGFTNGNLSGLRDRGWKGIQRPLPAVCQVFSLHGRRHCLCYNMYVCKIVSEKRIITMICTNCDVLFSGKIKCHTIYTISDYVVLNGLVKHIYQNMT